MIERGREGGREVRGNRENEGGGENWVEQRKGVDRERKGDISNLKSEYQYDPCLPTLSIQSRLDFQSIFSDICFFCSSLDFFSLSTEQCPR